MTTGSAIRLQRLFRHHRSRTFVVPLDHSLTSGPTARATGLDNLVAGICTSGADAVVLHKGNLRQVAPDHFTQTALILHLSGGTDLAPDPDAKHLVATVDEALRHGADGVSVHVNLGSAGEARQLADLAAVAGACDRWGMPLLAMVYPRGPRI
jgi:2-amino-4,5-dihydroxy-6-oxo-7-(phosphonooxy)heptanoate synthase